MKKIPILLLAIFVTTTAFAQTKAKSVTNAKQAKVAVDAPPGGSNDSIPMPPPPPPARPVKNSAAVIKPKAAKAAPESVKFTPPKIIKDTL